MPWTDAYCFSALRSAPIIAPKILHGRKVTLERREWLLQSDLADLVDFPRETVDIELKEWLDLEEPVAKAKIARHIAALANHGGGYLIFGSRDDLSIAANRPPDLGQFTRDRLTAIVKRYLQPAFQCDVAIVAASSGLEFPIVRVPAHGATPIVAKADGPSDAKGRPQGIASGVHYVRKPGPESAPASCPDDWRPLIRRCVLHDRAALLNEIAGVVRAPDAQAPARAAGRLAAWHKSSHARWAKLVKTSQQPWPVAITDNFCQLSYLIEAPDGASIASLKRVLEEVNAEVRATVWTGWSMFYPFTRPEIAPAVHPEHDDGTGADLLEASLLVPILTDTSLPDYWRIAPDGRATILRPYREDRPRDVAATGRPAGTWLSPETVIRETAELVAHAYALAQRLEGAISISFRCSWHGLSGRQIDEFDPSIYWSPGHVARAAQRTTSGEWPVAALSAERDQVVAEPACPVVSLFGIDCGPELVAGMAPRFIKL